MRILYCIKSLHNSGGMEKVLSVKANWLATHGHEVYIAAYRLKGRSPFFSLDTAVHVVDLSDAGHYKGRLRDRLSKVISELDPDICISLCCSDVYSLPLACAGRPCLAEYHFSHEKFYRKYSGFLLRPYASLRTRRLDRALARFDCLVTLTRSDIPVWSGIVKQVRQIYNPVTVPESSGHVPSQDGRRMIAVGRLEEQKNFKDLISAWSLVAVRHPDWRMTIFGDGRLKKEIQTQIEALGLVGKVSLGGVVKDISAEYSASSALVMSSLHEGFPLALVEACSSGIPVISYDCPTGPSEIISDARRDADAANGFLVELGNVDELVDCICRTIEDAELRRRMGEEARKTSIRFTPDHIMSQWVQLLSELTGKA